MGRFRKLEGIWRSNTVDITTICGTYRLEDIVK